MFVAHTRHSPIATCLSVFQHQRMAPGARSLAAVAATHAHHIPPQTVTHGASDSLPHLIHTITKAYSSLTFSAKAFISREAFQKMCGKAASGSRRRKYQGVERSVIKFMIRSSYSCCFSCSWCSASPCKNDWQSHTFEWGVCDSPAHIEA